MTLALLALSFSFVALSASLHALHYALLERKRYLAERAESQKSSPEVTHG